MESGYFFPIPRIEKYAGNPMKRVLHFQGKVIGITGIYGQEAIQTVLVYFMYRAFYYEEFVLSRKKEILWHTLQHSH